MHLPFSFFIDCFLDQCYPPTDCRSHILTFEHWVYFSCFSFSFALFVYLLDLLLSPNTFGQYLDSVRINIKISFLDELSFDYD